MMKFLRNIRPSDANNVYPLFFTLLFIFILLQYSFNSLEALFYDASARLAASDTQNRDYIIVTLDEESDQFLGEIYPYTYATHSRFLEKILNEAPKGIGYLVSMEETISLEERAFKNKLTESIKEYVANGGIFRFGTDRDILGERVPPGKLADLGYSLALINKDGSQFSKDNVTRRAILNISGEDTFHLWFAKNIRKKNGLTEIEAGGYRGAYYNREADATFSLFKYDINPLAYQSIKSIPFHRVVVGNYPENFFKNKIVLVGGQYLSNASDYIKTPFGGEGKRVPKLNVHTQIINSLVNEFTIIDMPNIVSDLLAAFIAMFLSLYISRVQPAKGLLMTMLLMLLIIVSALILFVTFNVWIKLAHIILSIFVVYYIWVPFRAIGEYQRRFASEEETKMLKTVDSLKQNFISLMSHDLKTPVAKIAGIVDILLTQFNNEGKQLELLRNINVATVELNNFISSILDLTKVESRDLQLRLEDKDLNITVEQVVEELKYEANVNKVLINLQLDPLYPIKIDTKLLRRVVSNLLGNAIKYSGEGSVINVSTRDDQSWVYLDIADNGVGIPEQDLEHIFEKFYRVKNNESHKIKGSGLGLYLVKYFIELHGGKILVQSEVGKGTSFTIQLKNE